MRWSMLPVSIGAHVILGGALVIVPLAAEDEWPQPAPLHSLVVVTKVVPVPAPMVRPLPQRTARAVDVNPGSTLLPEREVPIEPEGPVALGPPTDGLIGPVSIGVSDGFGTPSAIPVPPAPPQPPPAASVFRVGGAIREPKKIVDIRPIYPPFAVAAKVEGMVILEAVINERGVVERVKVLKSVPLLDAAAVDAIKQWRYTPTLLNGTPVSVLMTITLNFTLRD